MSRRSLALVVPALTLVAGVGGVCVGGGSAAGQVVYSEGTDLNGQAIGVIGVGNNTVTGALSATVGAAGVMNGDVTDAFAFTIPPAMHVTAIKLTINSYTGSPSPSIYPGVQIVGVQYLYCTAVSGTNTLTIPAPGNLGPGSYTFSVFTGLTPAFDSVGATRAMNYTVQIQGTADTGACCNRWNGSCSVLDPGTCAAVGLRYDGFASTCSPATCKSCPADFDGSGGLAIADIFAMLNAWFAGCP